MPSRAEIPPRRGVPAPSLRPHLHADRTKPPAMDMPKLAADEPGARLGRGRAGVHRGTGGGRSQAVSPLRGLRGLLPMRGGLHAGAVDHA